MDFSFGDAALEDDAAASSSEEEEEGSIQSTPMKSRRSWIARVICSMLLRNLLL
jgi:hypothetical protein